MLFAHQLPIVAATFLGTALLLYIWLRLAARRALLAVPNARSFHDTPKATGGGVALVVPVAVLLAWQWWQHDIPLAGALALSCVGIAILGFCDDLWELPARGRLPVQLALVVLVCVMGDWFVEALPGFPGWLWLPVVVVGSLWFLNLYNFMDGIDGIAASQAGAYAATCVLLADGDIGWIGTLLWVIVASNIAFLAFNWAPSKLFMGDVGSAFLGLLLAICALQLAVQQVVPLLASLILLSGFWFDASYTLCVRMITQQKFTQGHRSHLYQKLAARYGHGRTTAGYLAFFLLWLGPLAAFSPTGAVSGVGWCMLACAPLAVGCWRLRAGMPGADTVNRLP